MLLTQSTLGGKRGSLFPINHAGPCTLLYIYIYSRRERRCDARAGWGRLGWRSTSGAGCRKSFKELGTLFSINMYSFAICHSYVSYNHKLFCLVS